MAVATAIAVGSALASAGMSFAQANKQQRLMKDAQASADKALQEAKKNLEVNVYAAQGLNKEPYEKQREALLSTGAQAIEAGVESERGAAATAGRVLMAENEAQAQQAEAMNKDMMALNQQTLAEQSRLNDIGTQIDLQSAAGAQQAAANYADMAARSQAQGYQGLANAAAMGASAIDSGKTAGAKAFDKVLSNSSKAGIDAYKAIPSLGTVGGVDLSQLSGKTNAEIQAFMGGLPKDTVRAINDSLTKKAYGNYLGLNLNPFL